MSDSTRKTITTEWANAAAPTEITEPTVGKQDSGWAAEKPPYQNFNWAWQIFTNMLQNAEQNGVMEWKSTTTYSDGGWTKGSDGDIYVSQIASNTGNDPVGDAGTNWLPYKSTGRLHVRDEKANGTSGGTFTSGAWRTRDLNTVKTNTISGASLAANQITLPAGTYRVVATAPCNGGQLHKAKLYDITGADDLVIGTSENSTGGAEIDAVQTDSVVKGEFTIGATSAIELQHRSSETKTSTGFGDAVTFGVVEVYSEIEIFKI